MMRLFARYRNLDCRMLRLMSPVLLAILWAWSPASAALAVTPIPTFLELQPGGSYPMDQVPPLSARLLTSDGEPLPGLLVELQLNGVVLDRSRTDRYGRASFQPPSTLAVGDYRFEVVFKGYRAYQPTRAQVDLGIEPAEIRVQTLPPLSEVAFSLNGEVFQTAHDGIARIMVDQPGSYQLSLLPGELDEPGMRVEFQQWSPESFDQTIVFKVPQVTNVQIGFKLHHLVNLAFVDMDGEWVDSSRVDSVFIKSSDGERFTLDSFQGLWLPANSILTRMDGLDSVTVNHSVQQVMLDGSNVVNRGQQRFFVQNEGSVQLELLLFDVHFTARDPLFGVPLGSGVHLEYPDGARAYFPFESEAGVVVPLLARGSYRASIGSAPGLSFPIPIVLSRDQQVVMPVISYVDLAVGFAAALAFAAGLLLIGRTNWRDAHRHPPTRKPKKAVPSGTSMLNSPGGKRPSNRTS